MNFKSFFAAGATALALAAFANSAAADTRLHFGIGISPLQSNDCQWIGQQRHCFGPHFGNPHFDPRYGVGDQPHFTHRINCAEARMRVQDRGFRKVVTKECKGKSYSFSANKNGHRYLVKVNAHTGRIKARAM